MPLLMDVMRDHGLKVTFHLEPYGDNRIDSFASDIRYLVTESGDKRHAGFSVADAGSSSVELVIRPSGSMLTRRGAEASQVPFHTRSGRLRCSRPFRESTCMMSSGPS